MRVFRHAVVATLIFALLSPALASAQEPIRFARTPDISPDGKLIAFSYLGDIWTVEAIGGVARPVTMHEAHDINPVFSPDGKWIAFSSNRHGSYDVFVVPAVGGKPRRLTFDSAPDMATGWTPDGKSVVFSSSRSTAFPSSIDSYTVPVEGGAVRKLPLFEGKEAHFAPVGGAIAFVQGPGTWYRRGYRGSSNDDIWISNADGTVQRRLTTFDGQDGSPMWSPDAKKLYYVSEAGSKPGCANIVVQELVTREGGRAGGDGGGPGGGKGGAGSQANPEMMWALLQSRLNSTGDTLDLTQLPQANRDRMHLQASEFGVAPLPDGVITKAQFLKYCDLMIEARKLPHAVGNASRLTLHEDDSVRRARISGNGEWIVYECGADLYVVSTRLGSTTPRKVAIEVNADDKTNTERTVTFTRDATEFSLNNDENAAVIAVQGELFLVPIPDGGKAVRLTNSPAFDHGASFSPDGKSILFLSDRTGHEHTYLLQSDDPENPQLNKAHKLKVKQLTDMPEAESGATFSPRGDRIAFMRSGKLWTMNPDGTGQKVLVNETQVFDYDWSPDGKMLVYARTDGSFASELYIVPTDGAAAPKNITRYATYNGDVSWSKSGGKIGFLSQRRGTYAPHVLSLQRPGVPGASSEIDWDDMHLRVDRSAPMSADSVEISPTGSMIAFRSSASGDDLWVASSSGSNLTRVTTGGQSPHYIRWARKNPGTIYFLNGSGELRSVHMTPFSLGGSDSQKINFQAKMTVKRDEEFTEMFVQCWRSLSDNFYDSKHHGANWEAVRAKYQPLVAHIALKEDLYALISLMLGELNASHLGISGKLPTPEETTADLGLIFDETYRGPGLKVAEILKHGPADKRGLALKAGDIIVAIDRVELTGSVNLSSLLNNKAGETVLLEVTDAPKDPKSRHRVEVTAITRSRASQLMYDRWVRHNADAVAKASNGTIGYIHIPSMDDAGLEIFVRALYSDHFDKDALVIDVRYNGGGFTHDQVLNYLSGKEHTFFRQRDGGEGLVLRNFDRKWTKPVVVLTNNRSYSDAEIFPHAFRTLGLGKVVGQATGGLVIGTYSTKLIDGSTFRLPRTGVFTNKGVNMEKQGVIPDVAVEILPEDWAKGIDTQILRGVEVVSSDVREWKAKKSGGVPTTGAIAPTTPTSPTGPTTAPSGSGVGSPGTAPVKSPPAPTPPAAAPPAGKIPMAE